MNLKKTKADQIYRQLIQSYSDYKLIIEFFRNELNAFIQIETLLRQCRDDISYEYNLPLMRQELENVRTKKFHCIEERFGIFDFKEKHYLKRLIKEL